MDGIIAAADGVLGRGGNVRTCHAYARIGGRDFPGWDHRAICDCDARMEAAARNASGVEHTDFSSCGDTMAFAGELAREDVFLVVFY